MLLGERDRGKEICDVHGASAANASSQQTRVSLSFKTMDGIFCRSRDALRAHLGVLTRKIEPRSDWLVLDFRKLISQTRAAARLGKRCGVFRKLISRLNNILNKKRATGRGMGRLPATWEVMEAEMYARCTGAGVQSAAAGVPGNEERGGGGGRESEKDPDLLSDCQSAIKEIERAWREGEVRHETKGDRRALLEAICRIRAQMGIVVIMYVPAHTGCSPNEYADARNGDTIGVTHEQTWERRIKRSEGAEGGSATRCGEWGCAACLRGRGGKSQQVYCNLHAPQLSHKQATNTEYQNALLSKPVTHRSDPQLGRTMTHRTVVTTVVHRHTSGSDLSRVAQ